jgi:hypothetical protein
MYPKIRYKKGNINLITKTWTPPADIQVYSLLSGSGIASQRGRTYPERRTSNLKSFPKLKKNTVRKQRGSE